MKKLSRLLLLSYILSGCTLIGYDELATDAGRDASSQKDGETLQDAAAFDAGITKDAAIDSGEPESGSSDSAVDAGQTKDGALPEAGRHDAAQEDSGT
jgi:hypothetical protein